MDPLSLIAAHRRAQPARRRRNPEAEDRYWREQAEVFDLPRPGLRLIASIATAAGVFLLLMSVAQV